MTSRQNDSGRSDSSPESELSIYHNKETAVEYPPPIPVAMRHPRLVASVKQYRSEAQQQQLQQHIVSESFIPVTPDLVKQPRKRRRPPFSYSSLITQAILASENERMTLREIYKWIMDKYPALYDANDTGWQNTIRHNLSLNKCFIKIPKSSSGGAGSRGKGGYWTLDPNYASKFKNNNSVPSRQQPREIRMKPEPTSIPTTTAEATTSISTTNTITAENTNHNDNNDTPTLNVMHIHNLLN